MKVLRLLRIRPRTKAPGPGSDQHPAAEDARGCFALLVIVREKIFRSPSVSRMSEDGGIHDGCLLMSGSLKESLSSRVLQIAFSLAGDMPLSDNQ